MYEHEQVARQALDKCASVLESQGWEILRDDFPFHFAAKRGVLASVYYNAFAKQPFYEVQVLKDSGDVDLRYVERSYVNTPPVIRYLERVESERKGLYARS